MINNQNNILVTGGAGYIGSHIVENLVKTKNKVIIIDNLVTGYKRLIIKKVKFIKADIKNKQDFRAQTWAQMGQGQNWIQMDQRQK